ncbi:MAG: fibronectin type III domain-containing protein [Bacteroidales bacterium]|nr:fibronectin type III domain-containing protein [Bacteroidales bacterium]
MKQTLATFLSALFLIVTCMAASATPEEIGSRAMANRLRVEQRMHPRSNSNLLRHGGSARIGSLAAPAMKADAPARVTAGGANIYGNLWSSSAPTVKYGLYELTPTGSELKWTDPVIRQIGLPMQCGWLIDGKLCGYYVVTDYGSLGEHYYVEIDFETGFEVSTTQLGTDNGYFLCADYNTDDKYIYGYGLSKNYLFAFMKAPINDPGNITIVKELETDEDCLSFTYNRYDQKLYGVTAEGIFVTVDKYGNQTAVNSLEGINTQSVYSGLCYAPNEDIFYWNPQFNDGSSAIYTLDIKNATMKRMITCPYDEQFVFFVSPDRRATASTPEVPAIAGIDNKGGTLNPSVTITMPETLVAGGNLTGNLTWNAMIDGTKVQSGIAAPGTSVEVRFSNLEEGMHVFSFYVTNGGADSDFVSDTFFVGNDTPASPTDVTLSNTQVSWAPVTEGVNGGYVNLAELEYEVFLLDLRQDDPEPISIGTTRETHIDIPAAVASGLKRAAAYVVASSGGKSSAPGCSNEVGLGAALQLNVYIEPTQADFDAMTVIDANNDDRTWSYSIYQEALKSSFTSPGKGKMDDWLILPAIEFPSATDSYVFSADVRNCSSSSPDEFLEVLIGAAPDIESMTTAILPTFQPTREPATFEATFNVPAAGNYYIAFHTTSDEFQEGVLVTNIRVSRSTLTSNGPAEVTDIEATAAPGGELSATVSFTLPSTTHYGAPLDPATTVAATVSCVNSVEVSGAPGEKVSATVETAQGLNTITIVPRVGDESGKESAVEVYTGVAIPSYVSDLKTEVSPDMLTMTVTWNTPAEGMEGGYIDPEAVTYGAYRYYESFIGGGWELIEDLGTTRTYTFSVEAGSPQDQYLVGIVASNLAGRSDLVAIADAILGTPYRLPMIEDFDTEDEEGYIEFEYSPWIFYAPTEAYQATWTIVPMADIFSSGYDGNALVGLGSTAGDLGRIGIPRFSTEGAVRPQVTLNVYTGAAAAGLKVLGETYDSDGIVEVGTITATGEAVVPVTFTLPDGLCGKKWVQLYLDASYPTENHLCIVDAVGVLDDPNGGVAAAGTTLSGTVTGGLGEIIAEGFDGTEVKVFAIDGRLAAAATAVSASCHIAVAPGVYMVTAGTVNTKVVVR